MKENCEKPLRKYAEIFEKNLEEFCKMFKVKTLLLPSPCNVQFTRTVSSTSVQ